MARRSPNSHQLRMRELPHVARLHRAEPFRLADNAGLETAADRIAGPKGWESVAGRSPADAVDRRVRYRDPASAGALQGAATHRDWRHHALRVGTWPLHPETLRHMPP